MQWNSQIDHLISATPFHMHTLYQGVHVVLGSRLRPCKPHALDLTIANTWVRSSS